MVQPTPPSHPMIDRSARTLVVERSDVRRSMMVSGLRELGYTNLTGTKSIVHALAIMEADGEVWDWLVVPLAADEEVNALALLATCLQEPTLRNCRVSLVFESDELECVANAFELGLFSCHRRSRDMGSLLLSFDEISGVCERYEGNDCLASAHFLRNLLVKEERYADLLRLETALISLYPGNARIAIKVAEALYLNDYSQPALAALARLKGLTGDLAEEARRVTDQIMTAAGFDPEAATRFAALNGLRTCVVIDPDEAVRNLLEETLQSLGVPEIRCFADGEAAWRFLRASIEPDLIIQEWRIPRLSGAGLIQRIRSKGMLRVPIIVFSSLVKENVDRMLLKEMGVTDILEKPLPVKQLAVILSGFVREHARPRQIPGAVHKIRQFLKVRDFAQAKDILQELAALGPVPPGLKRQLEAEVAFYEGRLTDASQLAIEAMHLLGEDLLILNLLGKIYMRLRRFDQAQSFFSRAGALSPHNVERLCQLAEVHVEAGRIDDAEDVLAKAKKVDKDNDWVTEASVKVALAKGDTDSARASMLGLESMTGVIAFMNNRAVALALQGRLDDSIRLYQRTLASMPESMDEIKGVVGYNLALSLVKSGNLKGAQRCFKGLPKVRAGGVTAKIQSLSAKVNKAVMAGVDVVLNTGDDATVKGEARDEELMADTVRALPIAIGGEPGALRCHLVFNGVKAISAEVALMLATLPRFATRASIVRGKTSKTNKAAY